MVFDGLKVESTHDGVVICDLQGKNQYDVPSGNLT